MKVALIRYCLHWHDTNQVYGVIKAMTLSADTVLYNGKIHTMRTQSETVEAIAIKGDKIISAGRYTDIKSLFDNKTIEIDLKGRSVLPGLIDTHSHLETIAEGINLIQDAHDTHIFGDDDEHNADDCAYCKWVTRAAKSINSPEPVCHHKPDWETVERCDGYDAHEPVFDVSCRYCGASGAFRLAVGETVEIDW